MHQRDLWKSIQWFSFSRLENMPSPPLSFGSNAKLFVFLSNSLGLHLFVEHINFSANWLEFQAKLFYSLFSFKLMVLIWYLFCLFLFIFRFLFVSIRLFDLWWIWDWNAQRTHVRQKKTNQTCRAYGGNGNFMMMKTRKCFVYNRWRHIWHILVYFIPHINMPMKRFTSVSVFRFFLFVIFRRFFPDWVMIYLTFSFSSNVMVNRKDYFAILSK